MNTVALLKKIRRIQLQATHQVNDLLSGAYRSAFKGKGMEFEDVREYQPGDEIRTIDWNVTARMNRPYVKNFREERELTVTLVVDISASTRFGSGHQLKSELIAEISALLAFSAIKNHDKVALILFSDKIEKYLPPKNGVRHVLRVIRELLTYAPEHKKTDTAAALAFLGKVQRHSSICFLISDGITPDYSHEAAIIARQHDLISLTVVDPYENKIPTNHSLTLFKDLETDAERLVETPSINLNRELHENVQQRLRKHKALMNRLGGSFLTIETDKPYLLKLHHFFLSRQKRRR